MAKQELHVAVPSYFRCPISMEVMRSPVALCTGITYDRSSIQTWLDAGNLTCPATMQPLPSADYVPNLSVHRLIHVWSLSLSSPSSISPRHRICILMNRISAASSTAPVNFKELSVQLASVVRLARDSVDNRDALANSERFVASIVELMCRSGEKDFLEIAVNVLELALRESSRSKEKILKSGLDPIASVLRSGKPESKIAAAKILESIAINNESKLKIAETKGLINDLYSLITSNDERSIEVGLSTLISITTTKPLKSTLLRSGIVRSLGNILTSTNLTNTTFEKAIEMLELLATCSSGRSAICEDEMIITEIVKKLMKVSEKTNEHGITVLWSVCYLFRNNKAIAIVARSNGMAKCLLVLQSKCSMIVKQMCRDLVKVLRVDSARMELTSYDTKTTHIMPC